MRAAVLVWIFLRREKFLSPAKKLNLGFFGDPAHGLVMLLSGLHVSNKRNFV